MVKVFLRLLGVVEMVHQKQAEFTMGLLAVWPK
jgi:hypothetical protein